jgi:hypothetical protein
MITGTTRETVLTATVARLVAAATTAGANVERGRAEAVELAEAPAICVFVDDEADEIVTDFESGTTSPYMMRETTLTIACFCSGATDEARDIACGVLAEEARAALLSGVDGRAWRNAAGVSVVAGVRTSYRVSRDGQTRPGLVLLTLALQGPVQY